MDQQNPQRKRLGYYGNILITTRRLLFTPGSVKDCPDILKKDFPKEKMMNSVLDYLILIAVIGLSAIWITAVFCYVLFLLGVYDD